MENGSTELKSYTPINRNMRCIEMNSDRLLILNLCD